MTAPTKRRKRAFLTSSSKRFLRNSNRSQGIITTSNIASTLALVKSLQRRAKSRRRQKRGRLPRQRLKVRKGIRRCWRMWRALTSKTWARGRRHEMGFAELRMDWLDYLGSGWGFVASCTHIVGVWRSCHAFTSPKIFIARGMFTGFSPSVLSNQSDFKI